MQDDYSSQEIRSSSLSKGPRGAHCDRQFRSWELKEERVKDGPMSMQTEDLRCAGGSWGRHPAAGKTVRS